MKKGSRCALAILLHYLFMFILGFVVLFFSLFIDLIKRETGGGFWSVDFPSIGIVIAISFVATLLYREWSSWANGKTGIDKNFSIFD